MCRLMEWELEFLRLYTSTNLSNAKKAFEIKRKNTPAKLYRYRDVPAPKLSYRKSEIAEGKIFLSHPQKLNDPFECWSILHNTSPAAYMDKSTFINYYLKAGKSEELGIIRQNENWFEALTAWQSRKAPTLKGSQQIQLAIEDSIQNSMEEFNQEIRKRIIDMVRFACFSTTPTNLPMWYHYTNKRKGICLEYTTSDIKDTYQFNSLFPVQYVDCLPDMAYKLAHKDAVTLSMPTYLSFHKLKDWSYENEWRLIYDAGHWIRNGEKLPEGFGTNGVIIDFVKPSKVILGTDIEPKIEKEIVACAQEYNIAVVKSKLTEYGLCVD